MVRQFTIRYILVSGETSDILVRGDETIRELMDNINESAAKTYNYVECLLKGIVH